MPKEQTKKACNSEWRVDRSRCQKQERGNVFEWVQDWYHSDYTGAPVDDSAWENPVGANPVLRGGSFFTIAKGVRAFTRYKGLELIECVDWVFDDGAGIRWARRGPPTKCALERLPSEDAEVGTVLSCSFMRHLDLSQFAVETISQKDRSPRRAFSFIISREYTVNPIPSPVRSAGAPRSQAVERQRDTSCIRGVTSP